jgi:3-hydroxymyristoyl/3-hydroxydecanoyl-(acyl carrier protein) dehydratase
VPSNDLTFEVQEGFSEKTGGKASWVVPPDLPFFEGHFPDRPILPGVAILIITEKLLSQVFPSRALNVKEVRSAKFLAPILPGQKVEIAITLTKETELGVDWWVEKSEKTVAMLLLRLTA